GGERSVRVNLLQRFDGSRGSPVHHRRPSPKQEGSVPGARLGLGSIKPSRRVVGTARFDESSGLGQIPLGPSLPPDDQTETGEGQHQDSQHPAPHRRQSARSRVGPRHGRSSGIPSKAAEGNPWTIGKRPLHYSQKSDP